MSPRDLVPPAQHMLEAIVGLAHVVQPGGQGDVLREVLGKAQPSGETPCTSTDMAQVGCERHATFDERPTVTFSRDRGRPS